MTALPTLYATGVPTNLTTTWSGNVAYTDVDEGISGADGTEIADNNNATNDYYAYYSLTNMPTDFSSMDDISINIRYRVAGAQTNNRSLYVRIITDEATPVELTASRTIATNITTTTLTNSGALACTITGTPTKAQWDNAVIEIREAIVKNKGGDTNGIRVDTFEFTGNYTTGATPTIRTTSAASSTFSAQATTAVIDIITQTSVANATFSAQATTASNIQPGEKIEAQQKSILNNGTNKKINVLVIAPVIFQKTNKKVCNITTWPPPEPCGVDG